MCVWVFVLYLCLLNFAASNAWFWFTCYFRGDTMYLIYYMISFIYFCVLFLSQVHAIIMIFHVCVCVRVCIVRQEQSRSTCGSFVFFFLSKKLPFVIFLQRNVYIQNNARQLWSRWSEWHTDSFLISRHQSHLINICVRMCTKHVQQFYKWYQHKYAYLSIKIG